MLLLLSSSYPPPILLTLLRLALPHHSINKSSTPEEYISVLTRKQEQEKKSRLEIKLTKTICVHRLDPACQVSNFDDSQVHGQAYLNVFGLVLPQSLDV